MNQKTKLTFESKLAFLKLKQEKELARYPLAPTTVFIGPIPVVFTPILLVVIGVDGDVHVSLKASITHEASLTGGMNYSNGKLEPVSQHTDTFDYQLPSLSLGGDFKGYAGPRFQMLLYGIVGPEIKTDIYVKLEADIAETPWWKLYGGVDLSATFRMEVLSKKIADLAIPGVVGIKKLLVQATTPPEGLIYSSNNQSFVVEPTTGDSALLGSAPPLRSVRDSNRRFWIETDQNYSTFRIMQSSVDGSNTKILLTSEQLYAQFPPLNSSPTTLTVSANQKNLFFD